MQVMLSLRAIGNSGYPSRIVSRCLNVDSNPVDIQVAAIEAYRRMPCDMKVRKQLLKQIFIGLFCLNKFKHIQKFTSSNLCKLYHMDVRFGTKLDLIGPK